MENMIKDNIYEEKDAKTTSGWAVLFITIILLIAALAGVIVCAVEMDSSSSALVGAGFVVSLVYLCIGWIPFMGLRIMKPKSACSHAFRQVHRHAEKRGVLLRKPFLRSGFAEKRERKICRFVRSERRDNHNRD